MELEGHLAVRRTAGSVCVSVHHSLWHEEMQKRHDKGPTPQSVTCPPHERSNVPQLFWRGRRATFKHNWHRKYRVKRVQLQPRTAFVRKLQWALQKEANM